MFTEKTPQDTIERIARRKNGFTEVELAKERGKPANHCGPFVRSIKAAILKGTIIATSTIRNGKVVYVKAPGAPKATAPKAAKSRVARKRVSKTMSARASQPGREASAPTPNAVQETFKALGGDAQASKLLGDFFESLAGICRGLA